VACVDSGVVFFWVEPFSWPRYRNPEAMERSSGVQQIEYPGSEGSPRWRASGRAGSSFLGRLLVVPCSTNDA